MKAWQENQLQALHIVSCEDQLLQTLHEFGNQLGFDFCTFGLRVLLPVTNPKTLFVSNYPLAWQSQYQAKNYVDVDPTVKHSMASLLPIIWTDDIFDATPELWEEARSFGLRYGWAQSVRDFKGTAGMLTLARSDEPLTEQELTVNTAKMVWLAQIAHLAMSQYWMPKLMPEMDVKLSNREIAVLRWTADGKTAGEIAAILKISERTVNFHINNVVTKLNAANKTAAVIKAAMLGKL